MFAGAPPAPLPGGEATAVFVALITTSGVIVTAILAFLAQRMTRRVHRENRSDHGIVAQKLTELHDEVRGLSERTDRRFDNLGQNMGALREDHLRHLEWHIEDKRKGT